jgi:hypothetical protein
LAIVAGESFRIGAEVFDAAGELVEDAEVTWTALDPTLASIDAFGVVQTRGPGNARFVARCRGTEASATVRVAEVAATPVAAAPVTPVPPPASSPGATSASVEARLGGASGDGQPWAPPSAAAAPVRWGRWAGVAGVVLAVAGGVWLGTRPPPPPGPTPPRAVPVLNAAYVPLVQQRMGATAKARLRRSGRQPEVALVDSFDTGSTPPFEVRDGLARLPDSVRARPLKLPRYMLPKGEFYSRARVQRLGNAERSLFGIGFELEGPGAAAAVLLELELGTRPFAQLLLYRGESDRWEPVGQPVSLRRDRGASALIAATIEIMLIDGALTAFVNDAVVVDERVLVGVPTGQLVLYPRAGTAIDDLGALHFGGFRR